MYRMANHQDAECRVCPFFRSLNHEIAELQFLTHAGNVHSVAQLKQRLYAIKEGIRSCERCNDAQEAIKQWKSSN